MKQFVKALKTDSDCFQYIVTVLPGREKKRQEFLMGHKFAILQMIKNSLKQ